MKISVNFETNKTYTSGYKEYKVADYTCEVTIALVDGKNFKYTLEGDWFYELLKDHTPD